MGKKKKLHNTTCHSVPFANLTSGVAFAAFADSVPRTVDSDVRVRIVQWMSMLAMRFKRTLPTALITYPRLIGVVLKSFPLQTILTLVVHYARFARSAFFNFVGIRFIVRMSLWTMRLLDIDCRDTNASMVVDLARHRLNVSGIDASGDSAQMIAMQIKGDGFNEERVQQSVQGIVVTANTHQSVLVRLFRMPKPARAFIACVFDGNVRKEFLEQFQRQSNTAIIERGHMLKTSPLVCGLVYDGCTS